MRIGTRRFGAGFSKGPMPNYLDAMIASLTRNAEPIQREGTFRNWYRGMAQQHELNPDPDAPDQFYDYRGAFKANAKPDATGHWPSDFKKPGHPNMVVGGFHVQTGERVPGTQRARYDELVKLGWDPETAKRLDAMPEPRVIR